MKNVLFAICLGGLALFLAACGSKNKHADEISDKIPVKLMELKKEKVQKSIKASGQFTTEDEVYLSFKTGGIVKTVFVREGDRIRKGQLLAALDLTEINAAVAQAKAGYEKALRDYERAKNLHRDSVATLSQFQDAKTGLDLAAQQLETAKFNLRFSEIRALDDGYVLRRFINDGQMTAPGSPVIQTNGAAKGNWILRVSVSDNEWSAIKLNNKAIISTDANRGQQLNAKVLRKSEGIDPFSGTFTVDLKVLEKTTDMLASGLFGRAEIFPSENLEVWTAPYESILDGDGSTGYVFVTNDCRRANKVKVTIDGLNKEKVWISRGLENSKYLIVSGTAYLTDNSAINPDNDQKGAR